MLVVSIYIPAPPKGIMSFDNFWSLLYNHGSTDKRKIECSQLWASLTDDQQQQLFSTIATKLQEGRFVHYDPLRAMRENMPQQRKQQTLTMTEYYTRYGTTEPQDGWRQENPTGQKVIYVKS